MDMEKKGLSPAQRQINRYFPKKPIAFQPGLAQAMGSVNAGLLLYQLLYWHSKGKRLDGWIYKTVKELEAETGLTRNQQDTAIKICKKHGFLEVTRKGIPAKRHFKLDIECIEKQLPVLKKKAEIVYPNPPAQLAENQQSYTKNTHQTTPKITKDSFKTISSRGHTGIESLEGIIGRKGFT